MKILFYGLRHSHIYKLVERAMKHKDLEVVGLIEDDKETREQLIKQEGYTFLDKSYEEMLKTDVDVVAIAGCYGDRGTAIIKALTAGKHVISDKPFCTSLEELDQIEKLCKEKNLKLSCMLDLRYEQSSQKAKEI